MRSNAKFRDRYFDMIKVASTNNLPSLTATLYLMYAIGLDVRPITYQRLTNRVPGYTEEASIIIRKNWSARNIKRFLRYLLDIDSSITIFSNAPIWKLPLDKLTGPFSNKTQKYIDVNLNIDDKYKKQLPKLTGNHPHDYIKQTLKRLTTEPTYVTT